VQPARHDSGATAEEFFFQVMLPQSRFNCPVTPLEQGERG